jgi:hypothetical protein
MASSGHPRIFVQRQRGHRSITTTASHHGHLDRSFIEDAAARPEAPIAASARTWPGVERVDLRHGHFAGSSLSAGATAMTLTA